MNIKNTMKELERLLEFNSEEEKQELIDDLKSLKMENKTPEEILDKFMLKLDCSYRYKTANERELIKEEIEQYGKQQYNQGVLDCIENATTLKQENPVLWFASKVIESMKKLIKQ